MGDPRSEGPGAGSYALAIVGITGLALCIAAMWFGMRMVMDVGGMCASGNSPYEIQTQCPDGAPILLIPSGFLGFFFGFMMAVGFSRISSGAGSLVLLFWPALFLSLGWNFLQYSFDPPGGGSLDIGWLICGIVFVLMGVVPLFTLPSIVKSIKDGRAAVFSILIGGSAAGILGAWWLANAVA